MALITQRICDHKEAHGENRVDATEHEYTIDGKTVKVDQCPQCALPYEHMFGDLLLIGRTHPIVPSEEKPKYKRKKSDLERPFPCPFCNGIRYTTLGRLAPHIERDHRNESAAWRGSVGLV